VSRIAVAQELVKIAKELAGSTGGKSASVDKAVKELVVAYMNDNWLPAGAGKTGDRDLDQQTAELLKNMKVEKMAGDGLYWVTSKAKAYGDIKPAELKFTVRVEDES